MNMIESEIKAQMIKDLKVLELEITGALQSPRDGTYLIDKYNSVLHLVRSRVRNLMDELEDVNNG